MLQAASARNRILSLLFVLLFGGLLFYFLPQNSARPKIIYINETTEHQHDLALKMSLKIAEKRSGIENAFVRVRELPKDTSIEQLADQYFQNYRIGARTGAKGILFLYSEKENLFRIEVSYALEGIFPDIICRKMEEAARTYMLSEVPQDFLSELFITMNIAATNPKNKVELDSIQMPTWLESKYLSGGGGSSQKGYSWAPLDIERAIRFIPKGARAEFEPAKNADEVVKKYLKSLELGIGEPNLPLLTTGAQIFRWNIPRNEAQQKRVYSYFQKALPYRLLEGEQWALAIFKVGTPNLPIVLRKGKNGLWYVDEPKAWTWYHRFEDGNDFYPKFGDLPLRQELAKANPRRDPIYKERVATPSPPLYPYSFSEKVAELENKAASNSFEALKELGEFYFFELNWLTKAKIYLEKAKSVDPENLALRWRLYDVYVQSSLMEAALAELEFLAKKLPQDPEVQRWNDFYKKAYTFDRDEF